MHDPTREKFIAEIEEEGYSKLDNRPLKDREYVWMHEEGMAEWRVHKTFATHWDWVENKETKTIHFSEHQ